MTEERCRDCGRTAAEHPIKEQPPLKPTERGREMARESLLKRGFDPVYLDTTTMGVLIVDAMTELFATARAEGAEEMNAEWCEKVNSVLTTGGPAANASDAKFRIIDDLDEVRQDAEAIGEKRGLEQAAEAAVAEGTHLPRCAHNYCAGRRDARDAIRAIAAKEGER